MRISTKSSVNLLSLSYGWNQTDVLDAYKKKGHFSLFLLEAMSRGSLPSFSYRGQQHPLQKTRAWYGAFEKDMKKLYTEHRIAILSGMNFKMCKEEKYFPKQLNTLINTFGKYTLPCTKVVLCPNTFGVPGEGYGPLIGNTAYAIFTPDSKTDQTWLMIHEVCHSLLLPIFQSEEAKKRIKQTRFLMDKWSTKKFRSYYPKWEWMIEEYFIHTIEQYVTKTSIQEKMSWGMKRLPWFIKSWADFQTRRETNRSLNIHTWIIEMFLIMEKNEKESNMTE